MVHKQIGLTLALVRKMFFDFRACLVLAATFLGLFTAIGVVLARTSQHRFLEKERGLKQWAKRAIRKVARRDCKLEQLQPVTVELPSLEERSALLEIIEGRSSRIEEVKEGCREGSQKTETINQAVKNLEKKPPLKPLPC